LRSCFASGGFAIKAVGADAQKSSVLISLVTLMVALGTIVFAPSLSPTGCASGCTGRRIVSS